MKFSTIRRRQNPGALLALLLVVLAVFSATIRAKTDLRFHRIESASEIAEVEILRLVQDGRGMLWAGTNGMGLWRFDGGKWQPYSPGPGSPEPGHVVHALAADGAGGLWAGDFNGGLTWYDWAGDRFAAARSRDFDGVSIWSLLADIQGWLWVGTYDRGVARFKRSGGDVQWFAHAASKRHSLSGDRVNALYQDSDGGVWLGTNHGLDRFDPDRNAFVHYPLASGKDFSVKGIHARGDGQILVLGRRSLHLVDTREKTLLSLSAPQIPRRLSFSALLVDRSGWVWISVPGAGLYYLPPGAPEWRQVVHSQDNAYGLSTTDQRALLLERSGLMLTGGRGGINTFSHDENAFTVVRGAPAAEEKGMEPGIEWPWFDQDNSLWLAGADGLLQFDDQLEVQGRWPIAGKNKYRSTAGRLLGLSRVGPTILRLVSETGIHDFDLAQQQFSNAIRYLPITNPVAADASSDAVWILDAQSGLFQVMDPVTQLSPLAITGSSVTGNWAATDLLHDHLGNLWIGASSGLYWQTAGNSMVHHAGWRGSGGWPRVHTMLESGEKLWAVTDRGLVAVLPTRTGYQAQSLAAVNQRLVLPLSGLIAGQNGVLWLLDARSLLRYEPGHGKLQRIAHSNVLKRMELAGKRGAVAADGRIAIAALGQAVVFKPENLQITAHSPATVVTGATVFGDRRQHITPGTLVRGLELGYRDRMITFDLAVLGFDPSDGNRMRYRLQGFKNEWVNAGVANGATFTNLDPGEYRFVAQGSAGGSDWGASSTPISIVVRPAWWASRVAYLAYALAALMVGYFYWRSLTVRLRRQKEIAVDLREANEIKQNFVNSLEKRVHVATAELVNSVQTLELKNIELAASERKAKQASDFKTRFLANMSHDLRTPLTGLLGHLELLSCTGLDREQGHYVSTVQRSADDLLGIINDLLDVSKIEAGKLGIEYAPFRLRKLLEQSLEVLASLALDKGLDLGLRVAPEVPEYLVGDALRIKQVIANLVGNAIKFTERGRVRMEVNADCVAAAGVRLEFSVADTGIGIPDAAQEQIFEAFAQGDISMTRRFGGTGLGLTICKRLCDLMGGDLSFESEHGHGATFRFNIIVQAAPDQGQIALLQGSTVYLLGDDSDLRAELAAMLEWLGAGVKACAFPLRDTRVIDQGAQAVRAAIVLEDVHMAAHLSVIEVIERFGAENVWVFLPILDLKRLTRLEQRLGVPVLPVRGALDNIEEILLNTTDKGLRSSQPLSLDGLRVLVADDDEVVRLFLAAVLAKMGAEVSCTSNGADTLRELGQANHDIAVLDMEMPRVHGLDVVRKIRRNVPGGADLIVIGLSGHDDPEVRRIALEAGMDDFLSKPVTAGKLEQILKSLIPDPVPA